MDKRFNVSIVADVKEVTEEGEKEFTSDTLKFHDVGYEDLTRLEAVWTKLHGMLNDLGIENLEAGKSGKIPPGQAKKMR